MFVLLLTQALAADPDDGVAAVFGASVEMPAVRVRGNTLATGTWSQVPDALAVEIALAHYDIGTDDASVVKMIAYEGPRAQPRVRLTWVDLEDGFGREMADRSARHGCTPPALGGVWSGGNEIGVYATSEVPPGLVLVEHHPTIGALVGLAPGDTLTVRDVRRNGGLLRETVTVARESGSLIVRRGTDRERLCYTTE